MTYRSKFYLALFQVYDPLIRASQDSVSEVVDMPSYFNFLTVMALYSFIQEKVDVAVIEVGIGGEFDCTNVVPSPVVCGVSNLGLDHTNILGKFLSKGSNLYLL